MSESTVELSIVIVSWNTKDILRDCLVSVYAETKETDFEIIVVDNASEDGSADMVEQEFPQVILIRHPENSGFAAANNIGFGHCKAEFVLLLNSDTIVLDGALDKTIAYARTVPQYGVTSCRVLNDDKSLQPNCFMYPSILNSTLFVTGLYRIFPKNKFFGRQQMTWWDYNDEKEVQVIVGCFMMVRKEALEQVGPLDEQFFMYSEEVDWCYRFSSQGWKLGFFPGAEIIHLGGASAAKLGGDRALLKDRSSRRFYKKHWSKPAYLVALFLMFCFYATRLPGTILFALATGKQKYRKKVDNHWTGIKGLFTEKGV